MGINKTDNPKTELMVIIENSNLSDTQKKLWHEFINVVMDHEAMVVLRAIQENESSLGFLTENLRAKIEIIGSDGKIAWKDLLKHEKEYIESI